MNAINNILIPIDFSTTADDALRFTLGLFTNDYKPQVIAVHSCNTLDREKAIAKLNAKIDRIKSEFPYARKSTTTITLRPDCLTTTILDTQQEQNIDLIVMGTKGCEKEDSSVFSYTSELVLEADCPVLVIPESHQKNTIKKIALVLGKDEIDDHSVLQTLLVLARHLDAKVHVLTIVDKGDTGYGYSDTDEKNESTISYYLEDYYSSHIFRESEDIEAGIFDFVEENDIDMVTILPANHAKKNKPSEGKLTKLLALHTKVPLLTLD